MKPLTIVLSAGVIAGLVVFFTLEMCNWLGLLGGLVTVPIPVFVGMYAAIGFGSAWIALMFQRNLGRAEAEQLRSLEQRLQALERRGG